MGENEGTPARSPSEEQALSAPKHGSRSVESVLPAPRVSRDYCGGPLAGLGFRTTEFDPEEPRGFLDRHALLHSTHALAKRFLPAWIEAAEHPEKSDRQAIACQGDRPW
jgi:hypothetical protein